MAGLPPVWVGPRTEQRERERESRGRGREREQTERERDRDRKGTGKGTGGRGKTGSEVNLIRTYQFSSPTQLCVNDTHHSNRASCMH